MCISMLHYITKVFLEILVHWYSLSTKAWALRRIILPHFHPETNFKQTEKCKLQTDKKILLALFFSFVCR